MYVVSPAITDRHTIRVATTDEGPLIGWFLKQTPYASLDWDRPLSGTWLLAEQGNTPVGCVAVNPGIPVGHMDLLCIDPSLSKKQRALLARDLSYAGLEYLKQMGSQAVKIYIADQERGWQQVVSRRGCLPIDRGTIFLKRA